MAAPMPVDAPIEDVSVLLRGQILAVEGHTCDHHDGTLQRTKVLDVRLEGRHR